MQKLLIIDDDVELTTLFKEYLEQELYEIDVRHQGLEGLQAALSGDYALIILDIMLPDTSGTQILSQIRQRSLVPVLMFTAKGDDIDRIIGLETGADDYVPKPCSPRELVARIRAILRRAEHSNQSLTEAASIDVGPLRMNPASRRTWWHEEELKLTSTEFNLLQALAEQAGQVVSKHDLYMAGLGRPPSRYDRSLDVHMSSIRQKLGLQPDGESYIQTIRGQGYQFVRG